MRKNIVLGAVGLGIAGVFLTGGVANAGQTPEITLDKTTAVAGEQITIGGECFAQPWQKAPLRSSALEPGNAVGLKDGGPGVIGVAKVKKDVKPGTYTVSYDCGTKTLSAKLTIVDSKTKPQPTTRKAAPKAKEDGQVAVKPKGAADTGEGDVTPVVNAAPVQQESGPSASVYALGGGVLAATAGAGVFVFRRMRKGA